jgi:hypothetical protein
VEVVVRLHFQILNGSLLIGRALRAIPGLRIETRASLPVRKKLKLFEKQKRLSAG